MSQTQRQSSNAGRQQPAGRRKKKKSARYYRRKAIRILIVIAVPLLIIGALWAAWQFIYVPHKQAADRARSESISIEESTQRQQQYQETITAVQAAQPVGDISQQVLDALKAQALAGYSTDETTGEITRKEEAVAGSDQASYFIEHLGSYDDAILTFYLNNPERFEFVKAYPERDTLQTPPETLDESLESVPHLLQWDTRWGYLPYGDSTMYYAGCAPTSLSMAISYLKQDPSITPAAVKKYSEENGYYVSGVGSSHSLLDEYPAVEGIDVERIDVDQQAISQALQEGKVLIFNMTPGIFTQVGHFMVVAGEENGQLNVIDPNSNWRTKLWNYDDVLSTTAGVWALSNPEGQPSAAGGSSSGSQSASSLEV